MSAKSFLQALFGRRKYSLGYFVDNLPIGDVPLPSEVVLYPPREGEAGGPAVKAGDKVAAGQAIWPGSDAFGGGVHTPAGGEVVSVEPRMAPWGRPVLAVVIKSDGQTPKESKDDGYVNRKPEELWERVKKLGVVTLGLPAVPPAKLMGPVKLAAGDADKLFPPVKYVIVTALDQEPLLGVNQQLLRDRGEDIAEGLSLVKKLTDGAAIHIAVPVSLHYLASQVVSQAGAQIADVKPEYPRGIPHLLIKDILGVEVPIGKPARDLGVAVINVETVLAILGVVRYGLPVTEKVVTVLQQGGTPKNLKVKIGTPVREVLSAGGINMYEGDKLILGGPLMGWAQASDDVAVTAEVGGVIVQKGAAVEWYEDYACVNCGACVDACPVGLQPNLLGRCGEFEFLERAEEMDIAGCIECGLCGYVCSAGRPVMQYIQVAKVEIDKKKKQAEEEAA